MKISRPIFRLFWVLPCFFVCLFGASGKLQAAPAMESPVCASLVIVGDIQDRFERYQPESWRKSWNLPEGQTYIDVYVETVVFDENCDTQWKKEIYQLQNGGKAFNKGDCLQIKTQFSGDEFRIGHWILESQLMPPNICKLKSDRWR